MPEVKQVAMSRGCKVRAKGDEKMVAQVGTMEGHCIATRFTSSGGIRFTSG